MFFAPLQQNRRGANRSKVLGRYLEVLCLDSGPPGGCRTLFNRMQASILFSSVSSNKVAFANIRVLDMFHTGVGTTEVQTARGIVFWLLYWIKRLYLRRIGTNGGNGQ